MEAQPRTEMMGCRRGATWQWQLLALVLLAAAVGTLIPLVGDFQLWIAHRTEVLIALVGIACWRWSWFVLQNVRAVIYRYWTFPRLRRQADGAIIQSGPVPELTILATTYHEKAWITAAVFESLFSELSTLTGLERRAKVVVVSGSDEDDQNINRIFRECCERLTPSCPTQWPPQLTLLRGDRGKRPALASGMEEIAKGSPRPDGVVVFMDADTKLEPGTLQKVLPFFRLSPPVGALTTNESGLVQGSAWFAEWISLRFGLRHRTMCSIALSGKLLCLTGRLSVFRASVVIDPSFRALVEKDQIEHWLWGTFQMLSGDDKSTWYWLCKNGHRMLYVPDAMVTTIEVVTGSALTRAWANIRRWSGNSLRHSWRAIQLGPRKLGLFPWWCLVDQRLAMWTVMFGPTVALLGLLSGRYEIVASYFLWVLCSRISHAAIAWRHGKRFSAYYIPLEVFSDWAVAMAKVWILFHPAKQKWLNRGARTLDTTRAGAFYAWRAGFAHYLSGFSLAVLVTVVGLLVGFLPLAREARLFLSRSPTPRPVEYPISASSIPDQKALAKTSPLPEIGPVALNNEFAVTKAVVARPTSGNDAVIKATQLVEPPFELAN